MASDGQHYSAYGRPPPAQQQYNTHVASGDRQQQPQPGFVRYFSRGGYRGGGRGRFRRDFGQQDNERKRHRFVPGEGSPQDQSFRHSGPIRWFKSSFVEDPWAVLLRVAPHVLIPENPPVQPLQDLVPPAAFSAGDPDEIALDDDVRSHTETTVAAAAAADPDEISLDDDIPVSAPAAPALSGHNPVPVFNPDEIELDSIPANIAPPPGRRLQLPPPRNS